MYRALLSKYSSCLISTHNHLLTTCLLVTPQDVSKYQYPIEFATVLASALQCFNLVLPYPSLRTKAALSAGGLGLFVSSWNSLKNSEKLNVKGQIFKGAEAKYLTEFIFVVY